MLSDISPVLFALLAGMLFALGSQLQNLGLSQLDSRTGSAISITTSALLYWAMAPFLLHTSSWVLPAVLIFALVGVFRPAVSVNLAMKGMHYLGPTLSNTLSSTSPFFGTAVGVIILGETLTWPIAIGTTGIVGAVLMLSRKNKKIPESWPLWALALPIGAALIRSIGHVLTKIGMETVPDPYFASLVSFSVSAVITLSNLGLRSQNSGLNPRIGSQYWFVAGGICMGCALLSLNHALLHGQIITTVPIVALSPIFTMLMGLFIFKREKFNFRIVAAVLVVVPSVLLIALNR